MQYTPFASDIELPFYTSLASLKINHDKLDDSARKILGLYEIRVTDSANASCRMQIHGDALTSDAVSSGYYRAEGTIKNVNTIEEYRNADRGAILQQAGMTIWNAIIDGTIYACPSLLAHFAVLSFADLKKYRFSYWFAFPAIHSDPVWVTANPDGEESLSNLRTLSRHESAALSHAVHVWSSSIDSYQRGFFLARKNRYAITNEPGVDSPEPRIVQGNSTFDSHTKSDFSWEIAPLEAYESGFFDGRKFEDCYTCFADPSNYTNAPGWVLRNLLALVKHRWHLEKVQILRYRCSQLSPAEDCSSVLILESKISTPSHIESSPRTMPKVTGWERNLAGKLTGRTVDLTEYMDPKRLADQSVDLNLKLMKWRISPHLDLDKVKQTKCLLLGAGTLGSYVARNLLGWGVRKVTFVDNGSVSFSNPVRQPLFRFSDCLQGGAKKALQASRALLEIYPGVDTAGHVLSVPMVGHPMSNTDHTRREFELLKNLIEEHDAIFLLMDTREARWLPTVIGKAAGKIVMNAALGFDTFVVMRHGVKNASDPGSELGCYFCNDVVAPANSVKDQTLDQQCTVTRPGVAAIASALLVELFVSILQHPMGAAAPASAPGSEDGENHPLGILPHQIRGFLSTFENKSVLGKNYDCCSACSDKVIDAYKQGGWAFVERALAEDGYVETLSGLKEVQLRAEAAADIEWDEGSEEDTEEIELV
ncbi:hypothetical protein ASPZODRAFT_126301 [Penicilliopsis zonata CBS 506.65]|uniref:Ubiquitin-like modifier-activating enzyme ATG7 n=1 Tax=Penicilliopsis zonata CBS 506.65 TaxID=1073090 RepID=A0A1L9STB1_9EURO|nr:hypothetical protein ASPZODRAFT_126301 [Penicilliopsis zonata CBS 506.65]OJJ50439.1 hypothetical protein ASPZODRAFT_126301 [Penicilliopsis zonata CBS 506.65]